MSIREKMAAMEETAMAEVERTPAVLYKYCSVDTAEKIFRSGSVLLNSPFGFNDPFDMMLRVEWPEDDNVLRRAVAAYCPESEAEAAFQNALRRRGQFAGEMPPNVLELLGKMGVSCFSEARDNILMWGHYGDKHRGVCLGFRWQGIRAALVRSGLETGYMRVMKEVSYSDDFPVWKVGAPESDMNSLSTKASFWAYEQEWRIIVPQWAGQLQPFPKSAFGYVIFGAKISGDGKARIVQAALGTGHDPDFLQASMAKDKYALEIVPCKWANRS